MSSNIYKSAEQLYNHNLSLLPSQGYQALQQQQFYRKELNHQTCFGRSRTVTHTPTVWTTSHGRILRKARNQLLPVTQRVWVRLLESEFHIFSSILRKLRNKLTASDSWCVNQLKLLRGDNAMSSLYTDSSYLICSIVNYFLCNSKIVKIRLIRQMFEIFFLHQV